MIFISKRQGGFLGSIKLAEEMALKISVFLPRQFENQYNAEAYERTTGKEIWRQMASTGIIPDVFVAAVGTVGTETGTGCYL